MNKIYVILFISLLLTIIQEFQQLFRVMKSFLLNSFVILCCVGFVVYTEEFFQFLEM